MPYKSNDHRFHSNETKMEELIGQIIDIYEDYLTEIYNTEDENKVYIKDAVFNKFHDTIRSLFDIYCLSDTKIRADQSITLATVITDYFCLHIHKETSSRGTAKLTAKIIDTLLNWDCLLF